ncbi:MAG: hypothetical protein A2381_10205 [Bdellovibrionales bacterium RIFOXYB1_FULL_37_110]|nr:MAG: hypothetical protein A2417_02720 [Bdellovibrionales bacterium RIFOXYC1_FULL_37_79]OFZ61137.1 MAG: hypothetical protein A2381_10205 [Bdellovibrionales bacterium RIFOXYB1_FULL_37_110]OFZ65589.1 MAG: hypothetical protein A2577_02390 [Bdellovibrionales bacterium RIFOXYD1_FULL_36_51]
MKEIGKYLYPVISMIIGFMLGVLVIFMDMLELKVAGSYQELFSIIKSKNSYMITLCILPILFFLLGLFYRGKKALWQMCVKKQLEIKRMTGLTSIIKLSESIGNEFNNPLTIILGQVYLYRELNRPTNPDDICYKRLLIIEKEAKKLSHIAEKFIALSKASNLFNYVKIELNHLVDRISKLKREELRKANIDFTTKIENGDEVVEVDINGVLEVCSQLLDNAIYFAKDSGRPKINLNISVNKSQMDIVMEDNGIGVDPSILKEIFNPLFTTKKNYPGRGLGLFIAQKIAEAMNGSLQCLPTAEGAIFKFSLST